MNTRFKRIIIFCADVEKLVAFYRDSFGFAVIGNMDKSWTVVDAGTVEIAFHKIPEEYLPTPVEEFKITDSNTKLVFEIDTGLSSLRQHLLSKSVEIGDIKQFPGYNYILCDGHDPEGNVFQLVENI